MKETPANIEIVRAKGIDVATSWAGTAAATAPTVVWLHGLGGSSTAGFTGIASRPDLAGWRSLLLDLPGHGYSETPDGWRYGIEDMADLVLEVVSGLVLEPIALFGHSMGGSVAIACCHRRPGAIGRLIVAEPNLDPGKGSISVRITRQSEKRFAEQGYPALLRATRMQAATGDIERREWLRTLEVADPVAMHRCSTSLLAERQPTFRQQLTAASMPVAMIRGARSAFDTATGNDDLEGYVVPEAGHQMMSGNPAGFSEVLAEILRKS